MGILKKGEDMANKTGGDRWIINKSKNEREEVARDLTKRVSLWRVEEKKEKKRGI